MTRGYLCQISLLIMLLPIQIVLRSVRIKKYNPIWKNNDTQGISVDNSCQRKCKFNGDAIYTKQMLSER